MGVATTDDAYSKPRPCLATAGLAGPARNRPRCPKRALEPLFTKLLTNPAAFDRFSARTIPLHLSTNGSFAGWGSQAWAWEGQCTFRCSPREHQSESSGSGSGSASGSVEAGVVVGAVVVLLVSSRS